MNTVPLNDPLAGPPGPVTDQRPSDNLVERLVWLARAHHWLDRAAYRVGGETYRFADVYEGAGRAAAAFTEHGLGAGKRILLALPDGIDFVWAFLGALRCGAVAVPVNTDLHPDELRRAGEIAEPAAVVCEAGLAGYFPYTQIEPDELRANAGTPPPPVECTPDTPAFAVFTSSTTGDPRLCFHTHKDPEIFDRAVGSVISVTPDDVCYSVPRIHFAYGLGNSVLLPLLRGGTTVLTPKRASEEDALSVIKDHEVTVFYGQPSFYARLLGYPDHAVLSKLRLAVCAGEVLPDSLERRLRHLLGERLLNVYGTSEIGHAVTANVPSSHREGTVGQALAPYRLRVVDKSGEVVPSGTEGRLEVAGPTIAPGVPRGSDPPRRLEDEWYATGDAATVDDDGFLHIHGRADDIEIVGGANVHPGEIEDLFLQHPAVQEVAVCAKWRGAGPSTLRAYIVLRNDGDPETIRSALLATAKQTLTWYKVPEDIVFVTELPRTPTGKLRRREVRAMAANS